MTALFSILALFAAWAILAKLEDGNRVNRKHDLMLCGCDDCELFRRVNETLNNMYEIQDLIGRNSAEGQR